ncbi:MULTISPECIES: hypothetical protein [Priestia]|jgi:hypothetical protein|uniref:hypothetical protein n=1 Tax=Priestia TaxID=2800373 RepID=UPI000886B3BC|nr:hypothetical protein [Priestia megaterium]MED4256774.1 hypothetical protein [Priestia megaterium]SDE77962.1 hypothetical protein SAMN04487777_12627 [Priestia aryabhattai B8W22]
MGAVRTMAEPKVRILADVSVETRDKLEEVVQALGITKKEFFDQVIEDAHKKHVRNEN